MKHARIISMAAGIALALTSAAAAQRTMGSEPSPRTLGAPPYPGAAFVRTITGLDPYHTTAEYITRDDDRKVATFFERKLPDKRRVRYADRDIHMTVILMNPQSKMPSSLTADDRDLLEAEPNIQFSAFNQARYRTLVEYFRSRPGNEDKLNALLDGKTMIRYTYRMRLEDRSARNAVGVWRAADRDLQAFYGSILELRPDGRYMLKLPGGKAETGTYLVRDNIISMQTTRPLRGPARKTGNAIAGRATLSLELTGLPRLTFVRVPDKKPGPPPEPQRPAGTREDRNQ